jgi:3-deoxy-D-manno-octulosonic-acid transferase
VSGPQDSIGWKAYGGLVAALSLLHYAVLSKFGRGDEGGFAWFRRRLQPELPNVPPGRIWIHAVSAGESKVALALAEAIRAAGAELPLLVSSTTYSGVDRIGTIDRRLAEPFIMPIDTPEAQGRLFETLKPSLLVLVESEFWPAQFAAAEAAGVPVVVVNATLSPRSLARHQRFPALTRATILQAQRIHPQEEATAERYRALGVAPERLAVVGNLKLAGIGATAGGAGERHWVTFGNIHRAELEGLAPAIREIARQAPVLLVPRYPGKIAPEALREVLGKDLAIAGELPDAAGDSRIVWVDRMGVLAEAYGRSLVGVVCGTFADIGGHDLSEPLQQGAASVYGPDVTRQHALDVALRAAQAATPVAAAAQLPMVVARLLAEPELRAAAGQRFAALVDEMNHRLNRLAEELRALSDGETR